MTSIDKILIYDGSPRDILLNYVALLFSLIAVIFSLQALPKAFGYLRYFWVPLTIVLFGLQILLCTLVECVGVSIVWCALISFAGYCYHSFPVYENTSYIDTELGPQEIKPCCTFSKITLIIIIITSIIDITLIIYYAIILSYYTTIIHISAILLGLLLGFIFHIKTKKYNPYSMLFREPLQTDSSGTDSAGRNSNDA